MHFLLQLVIGIVLLPLGTLFLLKSYRIVRVIGKNAWAEEHLGEGGTYTLVKLFGMLLLAIGLLLAFRIIKVF